MKLEYFSPSGSMKDRMALAMIEGAERDGLLVCPANGWRPLIARSRDGARAGRSR